MYVTGGPRLLLRLEGAAVLVVAVVAYAHLGASWWLFGGLFLVPDLAFLGYTAGPKGGAWTYNVAHSYGSYVVLGLVAFAMGWALGGALALIGVAHVGFDRLVGYGLKYPTSFHDTHLGRIGRGRHEG